ncbi:MAG: hypothetical protein KKA19_02750, partial [Candidatus Margulisbacteria bacterium]|nr:hypothetical protein [Candidatus Margulisiibacteriota bacterium]
MTKKLLFLIFLQIIIFSLVLAEPKLPKQITLIYYNPQRNHQTIVMNTDKYLAGVVIGELGNSFSLEAMKAQAVVSRTWLIKNLKRHKSSPADFCSLAHCQVWRNPTAKSLQAVKDTQGEIIYPLPKEVFFTSSTTKKTDLAPNGKYYSAIAPDYYWKLTAPIDTIIKTFAINCSSIKNIYTDQKNIYLICSDKSYQMTKEEFFEKAIFSFGNQIIRSPFFNITRIENMVHFKGQGLGHGRGLPQWGAQARSEKGQDYQQIIKAYFPGHYVKKIDESKFPQELIEIISSLSL